MTTEAPPPPDDKPSGSAKASPAHKVAVLERRAEILVEAYLSRDDRKTAEAHGITDRTLRNWRADLGRNVPFSEIFLGKKLAAEQSWADRVPAALRTCIDFLQRAATDGDHKDPDMVHSVAGAYKLLSESDLARRMLERRLNGLSVPQPGQVGPVGAQARPSPTSAGSGAGRPAN